MLCQPVYLYSWDYKKEVYLERMQRHNDDYHNIFILLGG